ncbi:hypothetical protein EH230_12195 [Flavobacterium columnare]|uniref:DUF393 domain-containing protein n=1 Tax=Flavobacterium columnare TaxID=996 RepID=A0A437UD98_9FLAO|nr:hypothetical protein [Flavobacterium columnare]RVU91600.1 hypothetical protein EH230_12195 [Flavobacterium columnare]
MRTLQNQTLLYDEDCPLCKAYTTTFIKIGMLDTNGRKSYCSINLEEKSYVDIVRASNEIALIDNHNKTVIYGIDSLLKVIGNSFPIIQKIGNFKPIHCFLKKLYSFISYNRKVILPGNPKSKKVNCEPSFNLAYRIGYLLFSILITGFVLTKFSTLIPYIKQSSHFREIAIALGQLLFQMVFLHKDTLKKQMDYYGNLITVSLIGSILLSPMLVLNALTSLSFPIVAIWFFTVVLIMFFEHKRRVQLLELPSYLSYTWILYRIIVLVLLLKF